jgi:hypothetical protein
VRETLNLLLKFEQDVVAVEARIGELLSAPTSSSPE